MLLYQSVSPLRARPLAPVDSAVYPVKDKPASATAVVTFVIDVIIHAGAAPAPIASSSSCWLTCSLTIAYLSERNCRAPVHQYPDRYFSLASLNALAISRQNAFPFVGRHHAQIRQMVLIAVLRLRTDRTAGSQQEKRERMNEKQYGSTCRQLYNKDKRNGIRVNHNASGQVLQPFSCFREYPFFRRASL